MPVRVLVDRIIARPDEAESLLNEAVVLAHVTRHEHSQLGKLYRDHHDLYAAMLVAPVVKLVEYGLERYTRRGVQLRPLSG